MLGWRTLLGLWLAVSCAYPWSAPGHRIVAAVAERHLNPKALKNVRALLQDESMTTAANWADEAGASHHETAPWHYLNIPIETINPEPERYCPSTGCILSKVNEFAALLKSPGGTPAERSAALKFLIHFVADLHQPLHVGNHDDRGGSEWKLTFFDLPTNLHMVWDHELLARQNLDETAMIAQLDGLVRESWRRGTPRDWTLESFAVARDVAYKNVSAKLGEAYLEQCTPSLRTQLAKGGVRLAQLLNDIWN